MAKIGYIRVSRTIQNFDLQNDALNKVGVSRIFQDVMTRVKFDRVGLNACLDYLREGDTLVIWKLDRLGGNLGELIKMVDGLAKRGIDFCSITEDIDTSTPVGKLFFHVIGAIAEYERELIRERVMAGLKAARERGKVGGRKKSLNGKDIAFAKSLMANRDGLSVSEIAKKLGVSRATLYRYAGPGKKGDQNGE